MAHISQRMGEVRQSATTGLTARVKAMRAAGADIVGFGAGEPDFPTAPHVVAAAQEAAADPASHHYSASAGLPELRRAIADKTKRDSGLAADPGQVIVTNGAKAALYEAFQCLVDPGDEVLLPVPYWVSYPEIIRLAGGVPVEVFAGADQEYRVTVDQLESARTGRTKVLLFTSPSNPSGAVYHPAEVAAIGRWAADQGLWVVTDEMYEHFVYGDAEHASMPVVAPEVSERCVVVNGVSKAYAMTGWRVGWMIAPEDVAGAANRLQSHLSTNVANVSQLAALAALSGSLDYTAMMRDAFDRRRRVMHGMLNAMEGVVCPEPMGAFFAFPDLSAILRRPVAGRAVSSALELADVALDEAKVAFVPGEPFGAPGYARFSFAVSDEDMVQGLERLGDLLSR